MLAAAPADSLPQQPLVITLEDAVKIALSENVSVKVADQEIERTKYAKRGTYAALFPQIDGSASYHHPETDDVYGRPHPRNGKRRF